MITIRREGTAVRLDITAHIPSVGAQVFIFKWETGSETYAGLLADVLNTALMDRVREIRSMEYEAGWGDKASRKRPKRTWFLSNLKSER